jgi:hypothetical protein
LSETGISSSDDTIEMQIAKSMAGSSTLIPPAIFKKTSCVPMRKPQRFSSTASNMFNRFWSKPVGVRCGVPYEAGLTND